MLKLIRYSPETCFKLNQNVISNSVRLFNYDNWYKVEKKRAELVKKRQEEFLKNKSLFDLARFTAKAGLNEFKIWYNELKTDRKEALIIPKNGEYTPIFNFNSEEDVKKWAVSSDAGYKIGKSKAQLTLTPQRTGLFSGYLSNDFDKPEKMKAIYTGYANMQSITQLGSFMRKRNFNFRNYNCFLLKIRGDGRSYMLVLNTPEYYTATYTFAHSYPLYTRGGPYWQYAKIPFSKFFHVTHGRVADKQYRLLTDRIRNIGITCMDGVQGPFQLEIDFIAVLKDDEETEDFAYETYKVPKFITNT